MPGTTESAFPQFRTPSAAAVLVPRISRSSSLMDWAMRSARSGSVAATADAMSASALAFKFSLGDGLGDAFRVVWVGRCHR